MLTKEQLQDKIANGLCYLDGATGSNLRNAGMPKECCTEQWVLENPEVLLQLQRAYAKAGSQILYAPTFQAQPIALERVGLADRTEKLNAQLVALSRQAAPNCLIAGDLTTLAAFCESWNDNNIDLLIENYRRQIRGLIDGGADLLVAETLMYPQEAEAILAAAEMEGAGAVAYSFVMTADGSLYSGQDVIPVLKDLSDYAAAVGFNCVCADMMTPYLVRKLAKEIRLPLLCKPNAGNPVIGTDGIAKYDMGAEEFAQILLDCKRSGAKLLGGCCGTTPAHIAAVRAQIESTL
ncbi:MAG: homocysteine S-methyltransferase family protein [Ruminococcaceae bacterium]|nr:homocysteine S-methyltransferase family protein [Oscillospiraceae bacterium]